jgi:hypothetical protein
MEETMTTFAAGFNRISDIATLKDEVTTSGLANCVAIAAIDRTLESMRIAHYDTLNCTQQNDDNTLEVKLQPLIKFKEWFTGPGIDFKIGLGGIWFNNPTPLRHSLILALKEVFHHEPIVWGRSIRVHILNKHAVMEGSAVDDFWTPPAWQNAGTVIPYDELQ